MKFLIFLWSIICAKDCLDETGKGVKMQFSWKYIVKADAKFALKIRITALGHP